MEFKNKTLVEEINKQDGGKEMRVDLSIVESLISEKMNMELTSDELSVVKEILNTLNENAESISSPLEIIEFCKEALKYNPVAWFI